MAGKGMSGRPTIIDAKVRKIIMECVEIGMPYKYAAHAARISERVLYDWLEKGKQDIDAGVVSEYSEFVHDIEQGLASRVKKHMVRINDGVQVWHSSAWMLERRWRKDFGQDAAIIQELESRLQKIESAVQRSDDNPLNKPVNGSDDEQS